MSTQHHDVVVIGGGNAGISLAAKLRRDGFRDVAIVEPKQVHHYRPLLSYVASGMATLDDLRRPQANVIPDGCRWYADEVVAVDPGASLVHLAGGDTLTYDDLAVCPGSHVDWDALPGAEEAMRTPAAATSYLPELAPRTWTMLSSLRAGTAVFALSGRHVPCAPVGLKPLFMAADHWRRAGVLRSIRIELLVEGHRLVDQVQADEELRAAARTFGVHVRTGTAATSVDPTTQTLHLATPEGRATGQHLATPEGPDTVHYDALYLAPPHRAPRWVREGGLSVSAPRPGAPREGDPGGHARRTDAGGFMAVDHETLQHPAHATVWGLGDVAAVDALPSGGALRKQVPVVAHNIAARRTGRPMRRYDGYSVAPVTTSRRRLLLAEFDRAARPRPSVPFPDLVRPRRSTLLFDRYLEPRIYWHRLLKGHVS